MKKAFPATMDSLYDMLAFVVEQMKAQGFQESFLPKVELAAEEALVNVINYSGLTENDHIQINCENSENGEMKIQIIDSGIPYNPLEHIRKVDDETPVEQRELGGYGIFLITKIMDKVNYQRENNSNILTLTKFGCAK